MKNKSKVFISNIIRLFHSFYGYSWILLSFVLMSFTNVLSGQIFSAVQKDTAVIDFEGQPVIEEDSFAMISEGAVTFVEQYPAAEVRRLTALASKEEKMLSTFENILVAQGLPGELKYLSIIESNLQTHARSVKGAAGPWQLMPTEGKRLGLRISGKIDERRDITKSTIAASKMLKELYNNFGDWLLVMAAYNAGPNRVRKAMAKYKSNNYWDIEAGLPSQTRNHVKRFIATHYILEGKGGITTLTQDELMAYQSATENKSDSVVYSL